MEIILFPFLLAASFEKSALVPSWETIENANIHFHASYPKFSTMDLLPDT